MIKMMIIMMMRMHNLLVHLEVYEGVADDDPDKGDEEHKHVEGEVVQPTVHLYSKSGVRVHRVFCFDCWHAQRHELLRRTRD